MPEDHTNSTNETVRPEVSTVETSENVAPIVSPSETQDVEQQPSALVEVTPDHEPRPWLQAEQPRRKKWPIIAGVVAAVVVAVGVGGWSAYAFWYQNPDKVVMDAIANAVTAKTVIATGTLTGKMDDTTVKATIDGQFGYKEGGSALVNITTKGTDGQEVRFDVQGVHTPNGSDYIKLNNLKTIYQQILNDFVIVKSTKSAADTAMRDQIKQLYESLLGPIVNKIDGKWVEFKKTDIKKFGGESTSDYDCVSKALGTTGDDLGSLAEIGDRFQKNKFVIIKEQLGIVDGSQGYVIDFDKSKQAQFFESLKSTKLYKEIQSCSGQNSNPLDMLTDTSADSKSTTRYELWVSQFGHQLTKVRVVGSSTTNGKKDGYTLDLVPKFNSPISVGVPTDSIAFQDVVSPIFSQFLGLGSGTETSSSKL